MYTQHQLTETVVRQWPLSVLFNMISYARVWCNNCL